MKVYTFIAESAADAVTQIRSQLGAEAVVLNVRPLNGGGLARIWQKSRIEVMACLPDGTETAQSHPDAIPAGGGSSEAAQTAKGFSTEAPGLDASPPMPGGSHSRVNALLQGRYRSREESSGMAGEVGGQPGLAAAGEVPLDNGLDQETGCSGWRAAEILENTGVLPMFARKVVRQIQTWHGPKAPPTMADELMLLRAALKENWPKTNLRAGVGSRTRVFIGAPGVGKTTCLCKMLAQTVLVEGHSARVWRLDGRSPNTAEMLSVYCDILGVPLDRSIPVDEGPLQEDCLFVDLPGVDGADRKAVEELGTILGGFQGAEVLLVLNAAYELSVQLAQVRAFESLPLSGLVFSHLDEELRWGKIWNFVLGSRQTPRYLSAGQNIPGEFLEATAERILSRQFVQ